MAIEDEEIAINFHNGTLAAVTNKTINNFQGVSAGEFSSDLDAYDYTTSVATGVSASSELALTGTSSGRATSSPLSDLATAINTQGSFSNDAVNANGQNTVTYTFPPEVVSISLWALFCTTISQQVSIDVTVNGDTQNINSTGNTTGTFLTFDNVVPDGSNQVTVHAENIGPENNNFIVHMGHRIYNIEVAAGVTVDVPVGSMTITGQVPTVLIDVDVTVNIPAGALTLTGQTPTVLTGDDMVVDVPTGSITITGQAPTVLGPVGWVDDTFDGTGAMNPQWNLFDDSGGGVTNVGRDSGYFEGRLDSNAGNITRWFDGGKGRFDSQTIEVPASGIDTYIFEGVGVGPVGDRLANLGFQTNQFSFCGIMVRIANDDYMFEVVGHRGSSDQSTIEIKTTVNDSSTATSPAGTNVFGVGVTHCDMRVQIDSTGQALFSHRAIGDTAWDLINSGTGLTPSSFLLGSAGTQFELGIIGYASDTIGIPWLFTVNSAVLEDPNVNVEIPVGSLTLAGQAPVVIAPDNKQVTIPVGVLSLTGFAPFVDLGNQTIIPDSGIMLFNGKVPIVKIGGEVWTIEPDAVTIWNIQ